MEGRGGGSRDRPGAGLPPGARLATENSLGLSTRGEGWGPALRLAPRGPPVCLHTSAIVPGSCGAVDNCALDRPLLERRCRWCSGLFHVCASCFRGHAYCGMACRQAGYVARRRAANRRHRQSPEGRADHAARQRARRAEKRGCAVRVPDNTPRRSPSLRPLVVAALCGLSRSITEEGDEDDEKLPRCAVCGRASTVVVPLSWVDDRMARRWSLTGFAPGGAR